MKEYVYDGSFEGLLTAIFYAYGEKESCTITRTKTFIPSLINTIIKVNTEEDKAKRVYSSIENKLNTDILRNVYYLYLSDIDRVDDLILKYIKLCYKYGTKINLAKHNDIILLVDKYYRKVSYEAHRFTGFVRFKEVAPLTYYSSIEPDHNILPIILPHFTNRFSDQNFIIHDLNREQAIIYNKNFPIITDMTRDDGLLINAQNKDKEIENLWKTFYQSVNIKERENQRLRAQHMPKRYWKHLNEL